MYKPLRLLLFIFILLGSLTFVGTQFGFVQQVKASPDPDEYQSHPTNHNIEGLVEGSQIWNLTYAYDKDNGTYTRIDYGKGPKPGPDYFDVISFEAPYAFPITRVDFKMRYEAEVNTKGETYSIEYYVGTAGPVTLVAATGAAHPLGTDVWASQTEPKDGTWDWTDISNIKFRVSVSALAGGTMNSYFDEYEAWVTVYYTPPEIFVDPSSVSTARGFHIDINISNVEDLYTWSLRLSWNQSLFECQKVVEGPFLKLGGTTVFTKKIYNNLGYIYLVDSLMGVVPGVDGNGTLATVYFTSSKNNGNCSLHLYDTTLIDPYMGSIAHTLQDGSFDNRGLTLIPAASVYVDPSSVSTVRGFSVDIKVSTVTELNSFVFMLGWNSSLFECAAVKEGPFLKGGGSTFFYPMINNVAGLVIVSSRILGTATVSGSGTLATIYFTSSKDTGYCALDLYGTELGDQYGEYWYHTVTDGSFDNRGLTLIPAASVYVDPASTFTLNPFSIDIDISSATEVFMWEFSLAWDKALIDCTGVSQGTFLSAGGTTTFYYQIDNAAGKVLVNCTLQTGGTAQSGSGTLATISFSAAKASGNCTLDLYRSPKDYMLHDSNGMYWYHTVTDGFYNNTVVPEFPLGAAMEIGLAILVVYVLWKRKRKIGSFNNNRSVKTS